MNYQVLDRSQFVGRDSGGDILLERQIVAFIKNNINRKRVIDLGCGAAPWAIYAAQEGASYVMGIDIQQRMIEEGRKTVKEAELSEKQVTLVVGDVTNVRSRDKDFDCAMSLMVGCNLPILQMHLVEMARVLKVTGRAILAAPSSLDVVFTSGERELALVMVAIEQALDKVNVEDSTSIVENLSSLKDVYSATFFEDGDKLKLLTPDIHLENGTKIWRKVSENVFPNFYHSEEEYKIEVQKAGFKINKIEKPKFGEEAKLIAYNNKHSEERKLGIAYIDHNPFIIIELENEFRFFNELWILLNRLFLLIFSFFIARDS